jgi:hypothetical protein
VVWNLYRTTPLGTIGDLVDCRIDRKKVYFRTKAGDEMILSIRDGMTPKPSSDSSQPSPRQSTSIGQDSSRS